MHPQRLTGPVLHAHNGHVGQADKKGAHAHSVGLHRGLRRLDWRRNHRFSGPLYRRPVDPRYPLTRRSRPKRQ
jgi:hypothetical protein